MNCVICGESFTSVFSRDICGVCINAGRTKQESPMKCVIYGKENDRKICEECDAEIWAETKAQVKKLAERVKK